MHRAPKLRPSRPCLMGSLCSANRESPPTSANIAKMASPRSRTKFLFSLVLLFALFHSGYCASALEANSTQHPFTLSTFVVPASTSPASEASLSHQPVFLSEAVTEKGLEDDTVTPGEAVVTERPTRKPMPVLYRHGKILETSRLVSQDSMGGFRKAQPLRPHRLGLYPTELGPVFEAPSSSEEPSPVLPSSSLMETFMAFEPESSAPPVAASTSSTVDPKDVRPTRTVSTPLVITEAKMAEVQSADTSRADKTVTLFGFVDFTTSLSGTKIIFKPTATRRQESPQDQMPIAEPSPPSSSSANFEHLFKKSEVQEIKASKSSSSRRFPFRSSSRSSSAQPSQTQSRSEKFKTGLVKSKTGTTVRAGVTTEFTTLIYGTFIQGSYAHIIRSTSSIYATPTMHNPGVSMTTMVGSETSVASVGRPLSYPETNEDSELMNSDSVVVVGKSSSVVPSAVIITEGFILPSGSKPAESIQPTSTVPASDSTMMTGDVNLPSMPNVVPNELDSSMKPPASSSQSSTEAEIPTMLLADPSGSSMTSIQYVAPKRVESATVEPTSVTLYTTYTHFTTMYNSGSASVFSNHEVLSNVHTMMLPKTVSEPVGEQSQAPSSGNMRHMILIVSPTQTAATESASETPSVVEASTPSAQSAMNPLDETPSLSSSYDFTTYTYYTTFIKKGKTSITSRTSVVSNLVATPTSTSIVPTPSATLTEAATSTYFTTYTYYTTFFKRGSSRIRSREKVETNVVTIFPGSTVTATTEVLTPITVYKDHSPVVSFAKVPKVYLTTVDERTETNRADLTAAKATTTFTFLTTTTDSLGNEVVSTSFSTLEGLATQAPDISPTRRVRTDFTTFTYFSTTAHPGGVDEVNSRSEVITRYVTEEPSRKKRDVQQKLETTFTDLVTTFDHGRPVVSTRRHTVTLGTLHITDTVPLPAATRLEPAVTRVLEPALVREHIPIDPRPVDHTYYTTYTYFTTTLSHGIPVTQTRYEVVTQVRHIDATPGIPGAIGDRSSGSCRRCADAEYPRVVDAYPKIAPSTIYPGGRHHTAYSTLTFYTTHYPKGTSYVETRYSVVTNVATATVTNQLPGLRGPDPSCPHHHTTFTYFTTRFAGPTATVDVQKETVAKCDGAVPVIGATRVVPEHVVIEERHRPALVVHEDHRDHVHKPCTVCLPDYSRKTFYTTYTHYTTVLDNHGHPSVSTRYETYTDILSGVRPTRTRHVREATRESTVEDITPTKTRGAPPLTTILKNDQSEIYQREASSQLARIQRSSDRPVFAKRRLLQFQQPLGDPSSSYYLPQFTNYNDQPYASRVLQPSANNYYNPQQYDFQQYQPYQGYQQQNPYQHPYSEYPYEYHSQVPVPPQNDFHNQLAGFQQSFNPPTQHQPEPQQVPQQPPQNNLNQFSPLLSYDVNPPNQLVEPVPAIEASPPSRSLIRSSKLKRKTILRKTKPTPTFEFNPQTPVEFNPQAPVEFNPQTPLDFNPDSYVTPTRIRKSSVVRRRPQASDYSEVDGELAGVPAASPVLESSYFVLDTPSFIRSSRVVPRQRATSVFAPEPSAPSQFLFETAKVEEPVTEAPEPEKRRSKVRKNPDGTRKAIVSSRVQKARDPLTSVSAPITFYTTFTYMTTFLHGTHTVYQSRESVVTSVHSVVDPTLLSQISNGYWDGSTTPVSSRTRGFATTIVNLQSRLALQADEAPVASPVVEPSAITVTTLDLQQLENLGKTVYVLQTYMYTVVDEAGQLHTSSKTEIKSTIYTTPTALDVAPAEQMSISNGFLALDNTRTVNLANDVRNGKTTKVDLSLRTVVKLDNVGDAILATQAAVLDPSTIAPSSTVIGAYTTSQTVSPTPDDANRKRIKIKSVVRKRPSASIESSIVDPTELFESASIHGTPALSSSTEVLPELTSATVSPSKQLKRLKVTVRKKASKLLKPVLDSVVSTSDAETLRSAPKASQFRGRLRASRIISRRVRPSDLIRQSPVLSVTPVAFTTTTRLPIEVSGSTEYRDVELTTFSLVTSTITPSFFPASPKFTRPASIQASPVVLTYFTTTTYTVPVTRNGVATYSTSEHTNSRLVTQYPEPSSLQPSLVLDAALVNELQTPRISDFETKTMFTTYTYYTTYYSKGSTSVVSSLNVISNTVQVPVLSSIAPTAATPLTILKTSERLRVSTSYSTFTFYATLFNGTSSLVTPFEEVQSQVFTLTESFVVTRTVSIAPTSTAVLDVQSSAAPEPSQTSSSESFTLFTLAPASTSSRASGPLVPSVKTFLTTFTYFTTFFRQSSSYVISKESVVTSYATLFVDAGKLRPTTTKKPVQTTTTALDPRFPYTTYTSFTTYTFYTTLFGGKDKIVISSEQIVPQVVTKKVDATLANIAPTTTSYSTFTAPPVTEELPSSAQSSTRSTLTFELAPSTESSGSSSSITEPSTSLEPVQADVTTTTSSVPTVAMPEIIIRDQKPTLSVRKKAQAATTLSSAATTLPHTQTIILASSTRFFGRDRSLTHIGAGSTLLLITGTDGLISRSHGTPTATAPAIGTTSADSTKLISPSTTAPGTVLDLTDILGGKGGKLGEAIKGIVNLFNTKNGTESLSPSSKISRDDTSLPSGPIMVSSQEPLFIPLSPVLDISSFISPNSASPGMISPTSRADSKLTPVYKPEKPKEEKDAHIPLEKLMSDLSKAKTKILVDTPKISASSKRIIPSTTIRFEESNPSESVSVIVGAETIFFDEGASTEIPDVHGGLQPTGVLRSVAPTSQVVVVTPEVEIARDSLLPPGYEVQAQSSGGLWPTASFAPAETLVPEDGIKASKPTIYFQVSSTVVTESPAKEVDYGGVKVFIAGRGNRKPVEPVIKTEPSSQSTRKPLPNIFKVGNRKSGPSTTAKPASSVPKVKISFPKPPSPSEDRPEDTNDIFDAFKPFNNSNREQFDGPTPTPLCYPACDSSRHEICSPNPSKAARNKYICVCRPGYTRDTESTSSRCIASQTYLLPVHLVRASSKGSVQSQMPRLLHALKVSLEQTYMDTLGFPKGSLLDAKVNTVQKVTNFNNESSIVLTLALSQRATNTDLSLPSLSSQLARSASKLNDSLEQLQSPFVLLGSSPIDALKDLDECSSSDLNDCSAYAKCINVPGSFHCECKSGYQDLDSESPGRTCSSEIKNCQFCSARGSCILGVDNGVEKTTCRCNTMYLGRRCEINGLVLTIALPIALSLLTLTICCSVRRCRPRYRTNAVKPPLPQNKMAMAYPGSGSLLTASDKGHSDKTQMISDSSSEGETSHGGDHWHHHHHHHHSAMDGRHTQMSSGGYSGYGDSLADTLANHHLPSIVIPRVRPKLPVRQR